MKLTNEIIAEAIKSVMQVPRAILDVSNLADDVKSITDVWPGENDFLMAMSSTVRAILLVAEGRARYSVLKRDLRGWNCFHYHSTRRPTGKADMRLVFREKGDDIEVLGFGHRYLPLDFYDRVAANRERKGA